MKRSMMQRIAALSAAVFVTTTAGVSSAQSPVGGEYIVSSEVVSDVAVGEPADSSEISTAGSTTAATAGGGFAREYDQPDLFYNYYTQGNANRTNAQMYVSPIPVPPHVGHTYLTYQPFYPDEYLYWHKNRYHNYYDNGRGMNRTSVSYYAPPVRQAVSNIYWNYLRLPR